MVNNERALNLKAVAGLYAMPSTHIDLPKSLTTTSGLIKFKYEKHDIQAAFSGGAVDLRNTLAVGSKVRVSNFWKGDHLRFLLKMLQNELFCLSSIASLW